MVALSALCASSARAQDTPPPTEPSQAQLQMYLEALDAYEAQDYETAEKLLVATLALGEFDVFHFGLARVYFRTSRCDLAITEYEAAKASPSASTDLSAQIDKGLEELLTSCDGTLEVECLSPQTLLSVNDGPERACDGTPLELEPGPHIITATLDGQKLQKRVDIVGTRTSSVSFGLTRKLEPFDAPDPFFNSRRYVGVGIAGAGLVSLGASFAIDRAAVPRRREAFLTEAGADPASATTVRAAHAKLQRARAAVYVTTGLGAAALLSGAIITLWPTANEDSPALVTSGAYWGIQGRF